MISLINFAQERMKVKIVKLYAVNAVRDKDINKMQK